MICMKDEQYVDRTFHDGIGPIFRLRHPPQHAREIRRVAQVIVRIYVRQAPSVAVGERRKGRHLSDQAMRLDFANFDVVDLVSVWIERRKSTDSPDEHTHW